MSEKEEELTKEINIVKRKIDNSAYGDTTILENTLKRIYIKRARIKTTP